MAYRCDLTYQKLSSRRGEKLICIVLIGLVCTYIIFNSVVFVCQWRGYVSNSHPSEVLPLQWPEIPGGSIASGQAIQLGVSVEPLGETWRTCCSLYSFIQVDTSDCDCKQA